MKNYSHIILLLIACFFCLEATAQRIAIKGGLNLSEIFLYADDMEDDDPTEYSLVPGFHAGFTVDIPLNEYLSLEPGLLFTSRGMKTKYEYEDQTGGWPFDDTIAYHTVKRQSVLKNHYLDIPLSIKASYPIGAKSKLFGTVGGYLGIGLSGKLKSKTESQGETETSNSRVKWGNDMEQDHFKRLDIGLTFGAGIEIEAIAFSISYDLGLYNISTYQEDGTKFENRLLKFSTAYRFGG